MQVKYCLSNIKECVDPFAGVESVESRLIELGYLVVKDRDRFMGILTPEDVLSCGHVLVVDCLREKPRLAADDGIEKAVSLMNAENLRALPVFAPDGAYLGIVTYPRLLNEMSLLERPSSTVNVLNLVGAHDIEQVKNAFINELYHNTKNPIQVIYSAVNLIENTKENKERKLLLDSVLRSVKHIDDVINQLFSAYFSN